MTNKNRRVKHRRGLSFNRFTDSHYLTYLFNTVSVCYLMTFHYPYSLHIDIDVRWCSHLETLSYNSFSLVHVFYVWQTQLSIFHVVGFFWLDTKSFSLVNYMNPHHSLTLQSASVRRPCDVTKQGVGHTVSRSTHRTASSNQVLYTWKEHT